jgi:hypothetical protein
MPDARAVALVYIVIGLTNVERFLLCRCPQTMTYRAGSAGVEAAN